MWIDGGHSPSIILYGGEGQLEQLFQRLDDGLGLREKLAWRIR